MLRAVLNPGSSTVKIAAVRSFTSHLISYLSKTSKIFWVLLEKKEQTHK